jgi:predicted DNA-binding protein
MTKDKIYSFRVDDLTEREIEFIAKERGVSPGILIRDLLHKQIEEMLEETKSMSEKSVDQLIDDAQAILDMAKQKLKATEQPESEK